jgi:putative SOS response-associated peptidase YedK
MCGRFVLYTPISGIEKEFNIRHTLCDPGRSYNIAPGRDIAIVYDKEENRLVHCRWGFLPHWAKDPPASGGMINARAETVSEKPSFRNEFIKHRCLVVADGFYEWKRNGRSKTPLYVRLRSGRPFGFAGLYNIRASRERGKTCTCTIITTVANDLLGPVHDRMPVIVPKDMEETWLDPAIQDRDILLPLLAPYPSEEMEAHYVSPRVNSPGNDSPGNIDPIRDY